MHFPPPFKIEHSMFLRGKWRCYDQSGVKPGSNLPFQDVHLPFASLSDSGSLSRKWHKPTGMTHSQFLVLQITSNVKPEGVLINGNEADLIESGEQPPYSFQLVHGLKDFNEVTISWTNGFQMESAKLLIVSEAADE